MSLPTQRMSSDVFTPPRPTTPINSAFSPGEKDRQVRPDEGLRVCVDTILLMRLEEIKEGLRLNGLVVTGVKQDAALRLAHVLEAQLGSGSGPTLRQMRYLLWLWRDRNLAGRTLLSWSCLRTRGDTSRTISRWKSLKGNAAALTNLARRSAENHQL